jgi:hypothetical protein
MYVMYETHQWPCKHCTITIGIGGFIGTESVWLNVAVVNTTILYFGTVFIDLISLAFLF